MPQVLHIVEDVSPAGGGVASAVLELATHLNNDPMVHSVWAPRDEQLPLDGFPNLRLFPFSPKGEKWRSSPQLIEALDTVESGTVLHLHGVWMAPQWQAARWAIKHRRPFLLSPHNMLTPWFWNQGRLRKLKKWAYWVGMARRVFEKTPWVHALTPFEKKALGEFFPNERIIVLPNGIDLVKVDAERQKHAALPRASPIDEDYLLFLGRLHPVKGIELLIEAFAHQRATSVTALWIVGPIVDKRYFDRLISLVRRYGCERSVHFLSPVLGAAKWTLLSNARALCAPSFSEGLSMVALEAMAVSTPVVTTFQSGLAEIEQGGGYLCDPNVPSLSAVISRVIGWTSVERLRRGEQARAFVENRYSWAAVAPQWNAFYSQLVKGCS